MKVFHPAHPQAGGGESRAPLYRELGHIPVASPGVGGGSSPPSRCSTIDRSQTGGATAVATATVAAAPKLEKQQFRPWIRHPHGDCKQDID